MSIFICACGRHVDTDLEDFETYNDGDEFVCLPCYEAEWQRQHDYWKPLYDGEKSAGLLDDSARAIREAGQ